MRLIRGQARPGKTTHSAFLGMQSAVKGSEGHATQNREGAKEGREPTTVSRKTRHNRENGERPSERARERKSGRKRGAVTVRTSAESMLNAKKNSNHKKQHDDQAKIGNEDQFTLPGSEYRRRTSHGGSAKGPSLVETVVYTRHYSAQLAPAARE